MHGEINVLSTLPSSTRGELGWSKGTEVPSLPHVQCGVLGKREHPTRAPLKAAAASLQHCNQHL